MFPTVFFKPHFRVKAGCGEDPRTILYLDVLMLARVQNIFENLLAGKIIWLPQKIGIFCCLVVLSASLDTQISFYSCCIVCPKQLYATYSTVVNKMNLEKLL